MSVLSAPEARRRLAIIKISAGCHDCGYNKTSAALQFDHVHDNKYRTRNGTKEHVSDMAGRYAWSTILAEIAKCRVLCANCHAERTHAR